MRWLALVLALWLGAAAPAAADEDAEIAVWKERLDTAQAELTRAQQRADAAAASYMNMRHDRSIRGDEKADIVAARADTEQALADAQASLAETREEARRAGAPAAWVFAEPSEEPADSP